MEDCIVKLGKTKKMIRKMIQINLHITGYMSFIH